MSHTRREFISNGLGFVALGFTVPTMLMQASQAVAAQKAVAGNKGGKILVVIEMAGGNDGLNTVAPINDPLYAKLRPTIGVKTDRSGENRQRFGAPSQHGRAGQIV